MTPVIASHNLRELEDICDHIGLLHRGGILFSRDLDEMKLGLHKLQVIWQGEAPQAALEGMDILHQDRRGSLYTITARGTREDIQTVSRPRSRYSLNCCPCRLRRSLSVKRRWSVMTSNRSFFNVGFACARPCAATCGRPVLSFVGFFFCLPLPMAIICAKYVPG